MQANDSKTAARSAGSASSSAADVGTVPLVDLSPYHARLRGEVLAALMRVYDAGAFIAGAEVAAFEREFADWLGVAHAIGVSSGTDALLAALLSLDVGAGAEVVTTPFNFVAVVSAARAAGVRLRFADIELDSFAIDPRAVEAVITERTRAVVGVHLFGEPCSVNALSELCRRHGVALVEDAAQAIGGQHEGRRLGGIGELGCFSFFPSKSLGALGDAGAVVTDHASLAARIRRIRAHGAERKYHHVEYGGNLRLDEVQAAVLRIKLREVDARIERSRRHAERYSAAFLDVPELVTPSAAPGASFSLYTLRVLQHRDELARSLAESGVGCQIHYPTPLHLQPVLAELGLRAGAFPNAEQRAREVLSIPIYPELSERQRDFVIHRVCSFFR